MDFINYLNDNDEVVFSALCHIFARQIENAMSKQVDDPRTYTLRCPEAPLTKMALYVPTMTFAEVEFNVQPKGGKHFELCGRVEINGLSTDSPSLSLRNHDYHYRPEHSRLLRPRDFATECNRKVRTYESEAAYRAAEEKWERGVLAENAAMVTWWDILQQNEIISRLKV